MKNKKPIGSLPVYAALVGNSFVALIKLAAAFISGSSVLFSEAIHSLADTGNQGLIAIGLARSRKLPDEDYVYGYGRERFFWALISACGIFFLGAGVTVYHGIHSIFSGQGFEMSPIIFIVLALSFIVESATLAVAIREVRHRYFGSGLKSVFNTGDPVTLSVILEDGVAVLGVGIAFFSIILSRLTGWRYWDGIGSIIIGILLGCVAVILIMKNKNYLIGRTIPDDLREEIIELLESDPAVERVIDFKSAVLDIGIYRVKCEIEFNGNVLIKEIYRRGDLREEYENVKNDYEEFKKFCVDFADRVPRLVGKKIDEIEVKLKKENPEVKYIDIEIN
ncbi:MAG: cation diffusion facilitator family transporter [Patescibacteria group bacterium]|jgi:zinc transporter 9